MAARVRSPISPSRFIAIDQLNGVAHTLTLNQAWSFAGHRNLQIQFAAAAATNVWENEDFLRLEADTNGDGTFDTVIAEFRSDNPTHKDLVLVGSSPPRRLDLTFADFFIDLEPLLPAGAGPSIRLRLTASTSAADEEIAFDSLRLTGMPLPPTLPAAPSNLNATAGTATQIHLTWTDNATDETGFTVERKIGADGTWARIATLDANATGYTNSGLTADTTYFYRVAATNTAGASAWSNEASAAPPPETPPPAPAGLAATAASATSIHLAWTDHANNETGFVIQRKTGADGTWALMATLAVNATGFTNTGLATNTTYFYRVAATNAAGASAWSNEASATTPGSPPPATISNSPNPPATNVVFQGATDGTGINVRWRAVGTDQDNGSTFRMGDQTRVLSAITVRIHPNNFGANVPGSPLVLHFFAWDGTSLPGSFTPLWGVTNNLPSTVAPNDYIRWDVSSQNQVLAAGAYYGFVLGAAVEDPASGPNIFRIYDAASSLVADAFEVRRDYEFGSVSRPDHTVAPDARTDRDLLFYVEAVAPLPRFMQWAWQPDGNLRLTAAGLKEASYALDATADLTAPILWQPIATNTVVGGTVEYPDHPVTSVPQQFYRLRQVR